MYRISNYKKGILVFVVVYLRFLWSTNLFAMKVARILYYADEKK